ncbi:adenosylcobinamide-GDP ribazoletransferase [Pedobacter gandavensis]|uniref:Adenosylcobinamide-GDP ribazoletransferase n=1 Tax=Pedobacter gandavensis TaxID=2679963 RepID=A0ABR6ETU5_9SPHI|nr:adenosylcobinamide-GDP ribazoletransferase [Pedobacter gandavensis]MBB2148690.1 adenosylcobinamide-GDP ribazoletransferase [Pedobacter gandavensis]
MKEEIRIFFTAMMFYTQLPCPKWVDHNPEHLNKSTRYFPLIGWIVGGLSFLAFWISNNLFGADIAVLLSIAVGVYLTGSFHEDGFADVFDGFGGGWTKAKILDIMKDSRLGTYGVVALIFMFGLKYLALHKLLSFETFPAYIILLFFISYHSLARLTAIQITFTSKYSREDESSKSKPIAKAYTYKEVLGAYVFGLVPLLTLAYFYWQVVFVLLPLLLLYLTSQRYFNKWLDGYTGDCLGAVEQFAEVITLLTFLVLWKFM